MITPSSKFNQNVYKVLQEIEKGLFLHVGNSIAVDETSTLSIREIFEVVDYLREKEIIKDVSWYPLSTMAGSDQGPNPDPIERIFVEIADKNLFDKIYLDFKNRISDEWQGQYFRLYIPETFEFFIGVRKYKLPYKNENRATMLMELITQEPYRWWNRDEILKEWEIDDIKGENKPYDAARLLSRGINETARIDDFLDFTPKRVRINDKYIDVNS